MKAISIVGLHNTGKTTICESIIKELKSRGYKVGSIKQIHRDGFTIDPDEKSNTHRHHAAGSDLVTARSDNETSVIYTGELPISKILSFYDHDFVILEGVLDCNVPLIVAGKNIDEVKKYMDDRAVLISGIISNDVKDETLNLPVINSFDKKQLADFVVEHAIEPLYDFDTECCGKCGHTCREMTALIAKNEAKRSDCVLFKQKVQFMIDGNEIAMVPFVQRILKNAVLGVATELQGFEKNSEITVKFRV